jgi:mono/diheme cytochrome c family protein
MQRNAQQILCFSTLLVGLLAFEGCQEGTYKQGERLYKANCANCHLDHGEGLGLLMPSLAQADYLEKNRSQLPCIVRNGLSDSILVNGKPYQEIMPGAKHLSDIQITNILNYVLTSWGNQQPPFRLDEVRAELDQCR